MWKKWEMDNWQRSDAQKVEVKGGEEDQESDGRIVLRDLERVVGEWRTTLKDSTSWRLLIENILRKVRKEETKKKVAETMANLTPDDRDYKRRITTSTI